MHFNRSGTHNRFSSVLFAAAILFAVVYAARPCSAAVQYPADVVIISSVTGVRTPDAIAADCASGIRSALELTGRLFPEDEAKGLALFPDGLFDEQKLSAAYAKSGISRYWIITVKQDSVRLYATLDCIDASTAPVGRRTIRVSTSVIQNVSLLLEREVLLSLSGFELHAQLLRSGDMHIVRAGQWHGLCEGERLDTSEGMMTVVQTGRFSSSVRFDRETSAQTITIRKRPETVSRLLGDIDLRIRQNLARSKGLGAVLLPDEPAPEKRLFVSTVIMNSGTSLFVPGYGSFLAVSSMGFENPKPGFPGIAAGFFAEMVQLCAVPVSSGEHHWRSLVPWTEGGGRTRAEKRLQIGLWSTIPFTWAATYFDQLAVQYDHARVLPPGFENADASAAVWSLIVPGGGLFYKGYRAGGWGFYAAEMAAASVAAHYGWSDGGRRALCVLGAVKCAEIAIAWFLRPSYAVYTREYERENRATLDLSFAPDGRELSPRIAATLHF